MGLPKYDPNDPLQRALYLDYGYDRTSPVQRLLYGDFRNEGEPARPARPFWADAPEARGVPTPPPSTEPSLMDRARAAGLAAAEAQEVPGRGEFLAQMAHARAAIEQKHPGAAAAARVAATSTLPPAPPEQKAGTGPTLTGEPPYRVPGSPAYDLSELTSRDPEGRLRSTPEAEKRGLRFETVGAPQRFMGRGSVPSRRALSDFAAGTPYSEKVRALQGEGFSGDLKKPGTWTFSGGYPETGRTGPRTGTGTLSGVEQAMARRAWLESRVREEQGRELTDIGVEKEKALAQQAIEGAQLDPMELARIRAQGQYGGEAIKSQAEIAARQAAYERISPFLEAAIREKDPQRANLLLQVAAAVGNTILGQRVADPRFDMFSALLGMGAMGAPLGAGAGAVK